MFDFAQSESQKGSALILRSELVKHMFYQWPSCGLRVAFACFISGRCVADAWPLRKAENGNRNDFLSVAARGRQNSFNRGMLLQMAFLNQIGGTEL